MKWYVIVRPREEAAGKARFLRVYSSDVTLVPTLPDNKDCNGEEGDFELATSPAAKMLTAADRIECRPSHLSHLVVISLLLGILRERRTRCIGGRSNCIRGGPGWESSPSY